MDINEMLADFDRIYRLTSGLPREASVIAEICRNWISQRDAQRIVSERINQKLLTRELHRGRELPRYHR